MQEPEAIKLPNGLLLTRASPTAELQQLLLNVGVGRWRTRKDPRFGCDIAAGTAARWIREGLGEPPEWEEPGVGPILEVRVSKLDRAIIGTEDWIICVYDPNAYEPHFNQDSSEEAFLEHLSAQMGKKRLLACDAGHGQLWDFSIKIKRVRRHGYRDAVGPIVVTDNKLAISDLLQLRLLSGAYAWSYQEIAIENGAYNCRFIQIRPPDYVHPDYEQWQERHREGEPDFYVEFLRTESTIPTLERVIWQRHPSGNCRGPSY
jgi:hypothetical protein